MQITHEELVKLWGNGGTYITKEGKSYTVHKMSYGDFFLEPLGKERGETEGFATGTIWLRCIDRKNQIYSED
jgi:hypothetical protein